MQAFKTKDELQAFLTGTEKASKTLGFVPTMGALHEGHLSLITQAKSDNELVVCSIFVNPIQFNNQEDLKKYPRPLEKDLKKLESAGCDTVFIPDEREMYPEKAKESFDFGEMEKVMEGKFRKGHFNGVAVVVSRFFEMVKPDRAYFGQKDFQQLAIIRKLVEKINSPVEIIGCPTIREEDGLAMSSRNVRLSEKERKAAPKLYEELKKAKNKVGKESPKSVSASAEKSLGQSPEWKLEYFEIVHAKTLQPVQNWDEADEVVACAAAWLGNVRLIDNLTLIP